MNPVEERFLRTRMIAVQAVGLILALGLNVLVARYWGSAERGLLATVVLLASISAYLGGIGLSDTIVRAFAHDVEREEFQSWYLTSVVLVVVMGGATGLCGVAITGGPPTLIVQVAVLAALTQMIRVEVADCLALGRMRLFDMARSVQPAVLLAAFALLVPLADEQSAINTYVLAGFAAVLVLAFLKRPMFLGWSFGVPTREYLILGFHASLSALLYTSLARADLLLVAALASIEDAGRYAVALAASQTALVGPQALSFLSLRAGSRREEPDSRTAVLSFAVGGIVATASGLVLVAFEEQALGPDFAGTGLLVILMAPGLAALAHLRQGIAHSIGAGRGSRASKALLAGLTCMLMLDVLFVPKHGPVAAAVVSSVGYLVASAAYGIMARHERAYRGSGNSGE